MINDPTEQIQQLLNSHATNHIGIVAGIISPDVSGLMWAGADDLLNTKHDPLKLDDNTRFKLASNTKIFTSVIQFAFHQGYEATLGDYITATIDGQHIASKVSQVPILNLANYSPGFPTDNNGSWVPSRYLQNLPNLLTFLVKETEIPQNPTGSCYSYSNFGWALLAIAALRVRNESEKIYERWQLAVSDLAQDLNMTNTAADVSEMDPNLPVGHNKDGSMFPPNYNYGLRNPMLFGAGSIVSTGDDMMKWLKFHMGQGPKKPMNMLLLQQAQTWQLPQCGSNPPQNSPTVSLGWFHRTQTINNQQITYLCKDGGHSGFTSWMGFQSWVDTGQPSPLCPDEQSWRCSIRTTHH